ncbi:ABC transporter permease [Lysinibacillus sp. NPDC048646]|uniref:ABC transporter permease n=1 Tax=Lysinibacillus sp. NPDC048646 TaxID=3390574 RepID=UPI003D044BA1
MMSQFLLSLSDIWRKKGTTFILLIQLSMLLIIINLVMLSFNDLNRMKEEVQRLNSSEEIYSFMDFTDETQINELLNEESRVKDLTDLYDYIFSNNDFQAFSLYSATKPFDSATLQNIDVNNITVIQNTALIKFIYTNELFINYFHIAVEQGKLFSDVEYTKKTEIIPIVIGNKLQNYLQIGQRITDISGQQYEVIGILKEKTNYIDIMSSREFESLDYMIMLPQNKHNFVSNTYLDSIINKAYVVSDSESNVEKIIKYAASLDTYSFAYKSMLQQLDVVVRDKEKWIQMQLLLLSLVIIFTFISVTVSYLQFIEKHIYEFGIHILSGATIKDLALRICFQLIPLFLISDVIVISIFREFAVAKNTLGITIILGIALCIIPVTKISLIKMTSMLRWKNR